MEIPGKQWDDRMDAFAEGKRLGRDFMYSGIFYNKNPQYLENLAKLIKMLIDKIDKKIAYQVFKDFLENIDYHVPYKALYEQRIISKWQNLFKIIKSDKKASFYRRDQRAQFKVVELDIGNPSELSSHAGMVFLRVRGHEDEELTEELKYDLREELLREWLENTEDEWVRDYLKDVKEMLKNIKEGVFGSHYRFPYSTLAYYLFPVNFDRFENVILVSNVSMYTRKQDTKQKLWQRLSENKELKDLEYHLEEEGKSLKDLEALLDEALKEENLTKLRQDWLKFVKKVLQGEIKSEKLVGVFLKEEAKEKQTSLTYGLYEVPARDLELFVFYEDGTEKYIEELKNKLELISKKRYVGDVNISIKDVNAQIHKLFGGEGFFNILKKLEGNSRELKHEESVNLLYAIMYFTARINGFLRRNLDQKDKMEGVLLLLNTDLEKDQKYDFWDYISDVYDYYGLPFQTITKRFLSNISDSSLKNMLISLYKDSKILHFEYEGFKLPEEVVLHVLLEKPSSRFFYKRGDLSQASASRHYMYELYTIHAKEGKAQIQLEEKFFVMCDSFGADVENLRKYIKERLEDQRSRFCFISALKDGYASTLYKDLSSETEFERKSIFVRYKELKTAYVSKKAERNCLVIYTQQFKDLAKALGIRLEEDAAAIAIKPSSPQREFEDIYHPSLQVFYTEKIGWSSDEVYSQQHNLFLFTLIALSMYESEAFQVPFSKLSLYSKERNVYITIRRETEDGMKEDYLFPLNVVVYELIEFMRHVPGSGKVD